MFDYIHIYEHCGPDKFTHKTKYNRHTLPKSVWKRRHHYVPTEIKRVIREYCENLYENQLEYLGVISKFLKTYESIESDTRRNIKSEETYNIW